MTRCAASGLSTRSTAGSHSPGLWLPPLVRARQEVPALGPVDGPLREIQELLLNPLTPVLQIYLTGVSRGPDGLTVEGQPEALSVVGDGADGPLQLTAVSLRLTPSAWS